MTTNDYKNSFANNHWLTITPLSSPITITSLRTADRPISLLLVSHWLKNTSLLNTTIQLT